MKVKSRKNKTALRIFAMGAVAALVSIGLLSAAGGAAPVLSNSGGGSWTNYREISVTENSGSALTAYQVLAQLSGSNFPTSARSDGADIRFTDANGNELSYWIESWDYAGRNAKIWVKIPSISASATATIRMYYGNPSAGSSSNGDATFDFFDDASYDKSSSYVFRDIYAPGLSGSSLTYDTFNKRYHVTATGINDYNNDVIALTVSGKTFSNAEIFVNFTIPPNVQSINYQFGTVLRYSPSGVYYIKAVTAYNPDSIAIIKETNPPNWASTAPPISTSQFSGDVISGSYSYTFISRVSGSNLYGKFPIENKEIIGSDSSFSSGEFGIVGYAAYPGNSLDLYFNHMRIRKYTSSEPILTLGSEQPVSTPDPTLPTISISSPSNGQTFTTSTATISGTASDNIALSKVEVKVGAGTWQLASGTNSWSKEIVLSNGSNLVYARATDTSGNTAEASIAVFYAAPDITTPAITTPAITTPPLPVAPCLAVSHTSLKEEPEVGEEVLITVTIQNTCDGTAKNIRLSEHLPSSVSVSYVEGATSSTPNLVTWNGELEPNRAHAIIHTLKILEEKEIAIPVTIKYDDAQGNPKEPFTTILYIKADNPNPPSTTTWTRAPPATEKGSPGFTGLLVLIGLASATVLVRRR